MEPVPRPRSVWIACAAALLASAAAIVYIVTSAGDPGDGWALLWYLAALVCAGVLVFGDGSNVAEAKGLAVACVAIAALALVFTSDERATRAREERDSARIRAALPQAWLLVDGFTPGADDKARHLRDPDFPNQPTDAYCSEVLRGLRLECAAFYVADDKRTYVDAAVVAEVLDSRCVRGDRGQCDTLLGLAASAYPRFASTVLVE